MGGIYIYIYTIKGVMTDLQYSQLADASQCVASQMAWCETTAPPYIILLGNLESFTHLNSSAIKGDDFPD